MRSIDAPWTVAGVSCATDSENRVVVTLLVSGADGRTVHAHAPAFRTLRDALRKRFRALRLPPLPAALLSARSAPSTSSAALSALSDDLHVYFTALTAERAVAQSVQLREFLMLGRVTTMLASSKSGDSLSAASPVVGEDGLGRSARRRRADSGGPSRPRASTEQKLGLARQKELEHRRVQSAGGEGEGSAAVLCAAAVLLRPLPTDDIPLKGARPRVVTMKALGRDQVFVWNFVAPQPVGFQATFEGRPTHAYSVVNAGEETHGHFQPSGAGTLMLSFVDARIGRAFAMSSFSLTARAHVVTVEAYNAANSAAMQLMQRYSQRTVEATVTGGELALRANVDELEDSLARLAARNAKDVVRLRRCEQQNALLREQVRFLLFCLRSHLVLLFCSTFFSCISFVCSGAVC
jgi:hypothetical protein